MKKNWTNLFTTQLLGVVNDNLLKSLICFVSIYWVADEDKNLIIAAASATMVIPFILLSPLAGHLSQVHEKSKILAIAKLVEIPIMAIAIVGFISNSLWLVLFAMLCMGAQSALYSPAKYGLIKELSGSNNVSKQLGIMELLSFVGVLSGTLFAGTIADINQFQIGILGGSLIVIALLGWIASKRIVLEEIKNIIPTKKTLNPVAFLRTSYQNTKKYKGVNLSIIGLASFWFIGSMMQMNILIHCPETLGLSSTQTGFVTAFVAIGIGLGCWVSGLITKNRLEMGLVSFAGLGLSITTLLLSNSSLTTFQFIVVLMMAAFFGGLFKVPLNTWVQERTANKDLSNTLAYSNMIVFLFILLSAGVFGLLQGYLSTHSIFTFISITTVVVTLISFVKMPMRILRFILWVCSKLMFKVNIEGAHHIPTKSGGIIAANHVSLLDALLIIATAPRNVRFIMDEKVYNAPIIGRVFKKLNMIPVAKGKTKQDLDRFTDRCMKEVNNGHLICIFPEGQLSRNGQLLPFKKGIEHFSKLMDCPIIPLHMDNLVGTPLTQKTGTTKRYGFTIKTLQKKVFISVGEPIKNTITAFQLRQIIKDLEVANFSKRAEGLSHFEAIHEAKKQLFNKDEPFKNEDTLELENLVISTPNYMVKDLSGSPIHLKGSKLNSIGRPIPGVSCKVVDGQGRDLEKDEEGELLIKHSFSGQPIWRKTFRKASIDESGFVTLK